MKITFELTKEQISSLKEWMKSLPSGNEGAAGGRFSYILTPTNLGEVLKVVDNISKKELDLTDYSGW